MYWNNPYEQVQILPDEQLITKITVMYKYKNYPNVEDLVQESSQCTITDITPMYKYT